MNSNTMHATTAVEIVGTPHADENIRVHVNNTDALYFPHDLKNSSFTREGSDLVMQNETGGKVTVVNFFAMEGESSLPSVVLADGSLVAGEDFLRGQAPALTIRTSAGEGESSGTSGLGNYDDATGTLVGGIDRLGTLGLAQGETNNPLLQETALSVELATQAPPALPGSPLLAELPITPEDTPFPAAPADGHIAYNARAVLLTEGGVTTIRTPLLGANGTPIPSSAENVSAQWKLPEGAEPYFTVQTEQDMLVFTLTEAGVAALAAGENLYNYITLSSAQGIYTLQLIAVPRNTFDSATAIDSSETGGRRDSLFYGEWHMGKDYTAGNLSASDSADNIRMAGVVSKSTIDSGLGNDTVELGGMKGGSTVIAAEGTVAIAMQGTGPATGVQSDFSNPGTNTITAREIAMNIDMEQAAYGIKGDARITATGDIHLEATSAKNSAAGANSTSNSTTTIEAGGLLDVRVESTGAGLDNTSAYALGSASALTVQAGSISLSAKTAGKSNAAGISSTNTDTFASVTANGNIAIEALRTVTGTTNLGQGSRGLENSSSSLQVTSTTGDITITSADSGVIDTNSNATISSIRDAGAIGIKSRYNTAVTNVTAEQGTVTLNVNTIPNMPVGDEAWGTYTAGDAKTNITAQAVAMNVAGELRSTGVETYGKNSVTTVKADTIYIDVETTSDSAPATARGLVADFNNTGGGQGGTNVLEGTEVTLDVYGIKGATGMLANGLGKNVIASENVVIMANATQGVVYGVASTKTGTNSIESDSVTIQTATGNSRSVAMDAREDSKNIITAQEVNLQASTSHSSYLAIGMNVFDKNGVNIIQAQEDSRGMAVYITAKAGTLNNAYSMYAGGNGLNLIKGSTYADLIRLEGQIGSSATGTNKIETGAGNDRIELNGAVSGNFAVTGGEGFDTLVLHATNFTDFQNRYGAWLTGQAFTGMEIEHIQVVLDATTVNPQQVQDWFTANIPSATGHVDVAYDHSPDLGATGGADHDYTHTTYAATAEDVEGKTLHFQSAGDDYVHVKGNMTNATLTFDGGHDTLQVDGQFSGTIDATNNGAGVHLQANTFTQGSINLGSGNDWLSFGSIAAGTTIHAGAGNGDSMMLRLDNADELAGKFDLSGVQGIENLWIDATNSQPDTINDSFLTTAATALTGAEVYFLHDQNDTLDLHLWQSTSNTVTRESYDGTSITFMEYTNADDESLKIYIETLINS